MTLVGYIRSLAPLLRLPAGVSSRSVGASVLLGERSVAGGSAKREEGAGDNNNNKGERGEGGESVSISDSCVRRLLRLQEGAKEGEGTTLRVMVEGGGCSGFVYHFNLEEGQGKSGDVVFKKDGATVVVDEMSLDFLKGATIDFSEELIRSSFQVLENPNTDAACGCGASFALK